MSDTDWKEEYEAVKADREYWYKRARAAESELHILRSTVQTRTCSECTVVGCSCPVHTGLCTCGAGS